MNLSTFLKSPLLYFFIAAAFLSVLLPSPAVGLVAGLLFAAVFPKYCKAGKLSKWFLQISVILLGFGLQLEAVLKTGYQSIGITFVSISFTLGLGLLLGKLLKTEREISQLVSGGTAICGGSAIAAISAAIQASSTSIAVSMGIVFSLNAAALLFFPALGTHLNLSQNAFGLWAAIAIHDTSSVVAACSIFGPAALLTGTTVKLVRALWILPVSFVFAKLNQSKSKAGFPLFLLGFLAAAMCRQYIPGQEQIFDLLSTTGKKMMVGTLFLVGTGLKPSNLKQIGIKPLIQAIVLWAIITVVSLITIRTYPCLAQL
jgi:uncharacterized integral membrane protein (TIGR00698 family)